MPAKIIETPTFDQLIGWQGFCFLYQWIERVALWNKTVELRSIRASAKARNKGIVMCKKGKAFGWCKIQELETKSSERYANNDNIVEHQVLDIAKRTKVCSWRLIDVEMFATPIAFVQKKGQCSTIDFAKTVECTNLDASNYVYASRFKLTREQGADRRRSEEIHPQCPKMRGTVRSRRKLRHRQKTIQDSDTEDDDDTDDEDSDVVNESGDNNQNQDQDIDMTEHEEKTCTIEVFGTQSQTITTDMPSSYAVVKWAAQHLSQPFELLRESLAGFKRSGRENMGADLLRFGMKWLLTRYPPLTGVCADFSQLFMSKMQMVTPGRVDPMRMPGILSKDNPVVALAVLVDGNAEEGGDVCRGSDKKGASGHWILIIVDKSRESREIVIADALGGDEKKITARNAILFAKVENWFELHASEHCSSASKWSEQVFQPATRQKGGHTCGWWVLLFTNTFYSLMQTRDKWDFDDFVRSANAQCNEAEVGKLKSIMLSDIKARNARHIGKGSQCCNCSSFDIDRILTRRQRDSAARKSVPKRVLREKTEVVLEENGKMLVLIE